MWRNGTAVTTKIGYKNRNNQLNHGTRGVDGTDHNQVAYKVECLQCAHKYGANGTDVFQRLCPHCQGGKPGIKY